MRVNMSRRILSKDLLHLSAQMECQVAAVFHLVDGGRITKAGALLVFEIQPETQTRSVNPALADLAQAPYSRSFRQGVCDFGEICGRRDHGETVSFFGKANLLLSGLAGHVLMTVEHCLCTKRGMTRHFDGEVSPVGI